MAIIEFVKPTRVGRRKLRRGMVIQEEVRNLQELRTITEKYREKGYKRYH